MKLRRRTRASGAVVWFMDYRLRGERRQVVIPGIRLDPTPDLKPGTAAWTRAIKKGEKQAQEIAETYFLDLRRKDILGELAGPTLGEKMLTLEQAFREDLERHGISAWTRVMEREKADTILRILGKETRVANLAPAAIERYVKTRTAEGVKASTINTELTRFRGTLNRLHKRGRISRVPVEIKRLPQERPQKRALTGEEARRLLLVAKGQDQSLYETLMLFLSTGLRRSELYSLRWRDIDFARGEMHVLTRKRGASNQVYRDILPVAPLVLDILQARRERIEGKGEDDLVFGIPPEKRQPARNGKAKSAPGHHRGVPCLWDHRLRTKLQRAAKDAGIVWWKELSPHSLRHSFASILLSGGATLREVASLLRHRDERLTIATYAHAESGRLRSAVTALGFAEAKVIDIAEGAQDPQPLLPVGDAAAEGACR